MIKIANPIKIKVVICSAIGTPLLKILLKNRFTSSRKVELICFIFSKNMEIILLVVFVLD